MKSRMSRIRVLHGYRGRASQEKYIPAGEYMMDDPILRGTGEYLVLNGHAMALESVEIPEDKGKREEKSTPVDNSNAMELTRDEIIAELEEMGVDFSKRSSTSRLRETLNELNE